MKKFYIFVCSFLLFAIIAFQVVEHINFQSSLKEMSAPADSEHSALNPDDGIITISISAVGDCFFGADVNSAGTYDFNDVMAKNDNDYSYCFKNVKEYFAADDITLINLEGCMSENGARLDKEFAFRSKPEYVNIMTGSSVEVANLSNNHSRDYGEVALQDTKDILTENGITYIIGSETAIIEKKGIKIGFIGTNEQRYDESTTFLKNLDSLKEQNPDIIVAVFHWGIEREALPTQAQQNLAHTAIDNGVDLVIGHHPHVLQGIEKYNGKYIVYSLGNFAFGGNKNPTDKDTMIFNQVFSFKEGKLLDIDNASIIPCSISSVDNINNYQPTPLSGDEFTRVKGKITERSKDMTGIEDIKFIEG